MSAYMPKIRVPKKYYLKLCETRDRLKKEQYGSVPLWRAIQEVEKERLSIQRSTRKKGGFDDFW